MKSKSCRSPLLLGLHLPHTEPQPGSLQPHVDHGVFRAHPRLQDKIQSFQGEEVSDSEQIQIVTIVFGYEEPQSHSVNKYMTLE